MGRTSAGELAARTGSDSRHGNDGKRVKHLSQAEKWRQAGFRTFSKGDPRWQN
jgi:hypothetical protein